MKDKENFNETFKMLSSMSDRIYDELQGKPVSTKEEIESLFKKLITQLDKEINEIEGEENEN